MIGSAGSDRGPWGRRVWKLVAALTAIGLTGIGIVFGEVFVLSWRAIGPGCQVGGGPPIYGFLTLGVFGLVLLAGVTALGLLMFRLQFVIGPVVLVLSNLLVLGFYGFMSPVFPGQLLWGLLIVGVGAAPAAAVAILGWSVVTRGPLWARAAELVILTLIAVPFVWIYGVGVTSDLQSAFTPSTHPIVFSPNPGTCV